MLTFLAPGYLFAAAAAAVGLIAAHFIVRRHPRAMMFPTARFVPDVAVLTTGWARRPRDLMLLALRVLCIALVGTALAGPVIRGAAADRARVILADRSRAVADSSEVSDSVAAVRARGDIVVDFPVLGAAGGSHAGGPQAGGTAVPASLSAGLVAAIRAASALRGAADSVELVIVSPFAREEVDAATARIRALWPGRARLVPVTSLAPTPLDDAPVLRAAPPQNVADDPLAVALALSQPRVAAETRIVRGPLATADSGWVADGTGRVLVHWPVSTPPLGFSQREGRSEIGALTAESSTVVAVFGRAWRYAPAQGARAVAFWADGDVAAAESVHGGGCIRSVAVPVPSAGDLVLRPDFHAVLRDLLARCGGAAGFEPVPEAMLTRLAGPPQLATADAFEPARLDTSRATPWLLLAAIVCLVLEMLLRHGRGVSREEELAGGSEPARKAA